MTSNNFIFSNRVIPRISRHLLFWLSVCFLYFVFTVSVYFTIPINSSALEFTSSDIIHDLVSPDFSGALIEPLANLLVLIPYCYLFAYRLVPSLLMKGKYLHFGLWVFALTLLVVVVNLFFWGLSWETSTDQLLEMLWFTAIIFVNLSPPIVCGLFITIKMLKTWHIKEEEKMTLVLENANAELQLLKAQVHPHFLFNTLNNIYSFALNRSTKANELVSKLSAVLKYMINECEASLVPVEKEIKMIQDYIGLEKVRYGDRLKLDVHIQRNSSEKLIVPFLLIPFVENSFKHGASEVLNNPWIKLELSVNDDHLYFELSNSLPNGIISNDKKGIGLSNVRKRLQLLYPLSHELKIMNDDSHFVVRLKVPLQNVEATHFAHESKQSPQVMPVMLYDK